VNGQLQTHVPTAGINGGHARTNGNSVNTNHLSISSGDVPKRKVSNYRDESDEVSDDHKLCIYK